MAQPATPFTTAITDTPIAVGQHQRLILRCESGGTVLVVIAVGRPATAIDADYFLTAGDPVEITPKVQTVVNVRAITGTPKVYWRLETVEYGGN